MSDFGINSQDDPASGMKNLKKILISLLFIAIAAISVYFIFFNIKLNNGQLSTVVSVTPSDTATPTPGSNGGYKTFIFNNFHGSSDISMKFQIQYPANWYNDGQYFSPQKIRFYDLYSVEAPIYFDLILADIFGQTEFNYQIDTDKRITKDTTGKIDGKDFIKYDLIDYGSYGGESAGRVKIFVGPKIRIDGDDYFLVFHWEEKPLAEVMPGNSVEVFDNMLLSLKFIN